MRGLIGQLLFWGVILYLGYLGWEWFTKDDTVITHYYEDGNLQEEINKVDGTRIIYYKTGGVKSRVFCEKNKQYECLMESYYKNGKLKSRIPYRYGVPEGVAKDYYKSGKLLSEQFYRKGKLEGLKRTYYESGRVESECLFKDDKLNGVFKTYYE